MAGLLDLVQLAQDNTWMMVLLLIIGQIVIFRLGRSKLNTAATEREEIEETQEDITEQVNRVDQKQDHIVERQEMVLDQMGINSDEIASLREETARLNAKHDEGTD